MLVYSYFSSNLWIESLISNEPRVEMSLVMYKPFQSTNSFVYKNKWSEPLQGMENVLIYNSLATQHAEIGVVLL